MIVVLCFSIFWIIYGILGILGIQNIPEKYKGSDFEKEYKRYRGISWLLLGIPMFVFWLVVHNMDISSKVLFVIVMIVIALPAIIYDFVVGRKYQKLLKK
ncbi:MAG: hypothetical protein SPL05_05090 [Eubacteriales bacterium]|nr:hypothetical protein [Eubacteriales bacterium]